MWLSVCCTNSQLVGPACNMQKCATLWAAVYWPGIGRCLFKPSRKVAGCRRARGWIEEVCPTSADFTSLSGHTVHSYLVLTREWRLGDCVRNWVIVSLHTTWWVCNTQLWNGGIHHTIHTITIITMCIVIERIWWLGFEVQRNLWLGLT